MYLDRVLFAGAVAAAILLSGFSCTFSQTKSNADSLSTVPSQSIGDMHHLDGQFSLPVVNNPDMVVHPRDGDSNRVEWLSGAIPSSGLSIEPVEAGPLSPNISRPDPVKLGILGAVAVTGVIYLE